MTSRAASSLFALCFVTSLLCCVLGVHHHSFGKDVGTSQLGVVIGTQHTVRYQGDGRRRRSRRRRRKTVGAETVGERDIDYAGTRHGGSCGAGLRPEAVKSERCDDAACHMCDHKTDDGCWYGTQERSGGCGEMTLRVQANSLFTRFVQEVFFKCSSAGGVWNMKVYMVENGKINVYVDNALVKGNVVKTHEFKFKTASARVRAEFVPTDRNAASRAEAKFEVLEMSTASDSCMTSKNCLSILGDGSDIGYELRNNNKLQAKCLESGASSLPNHLQTKCLAWEGCLPAENKRSLKALLMASGASGFASFADAGSNANGNLTASDDPNGCINPAVDDPESWDCECVENMIKTCNGVDEACFQSIMCNSAEVCQTWKDAAQCAALIQAGKDNSISMRDGDLKTKMTHEDVSSGKQRGDLKANKAVSSAMDSGHLNAALGERGQDDASNGVSDALDGSLQGKCSQ